MRRALFLCLLFAAPALGQESCDACRPEDEIQLGDYLPPVVPAPRAVTPSDPRGRPLSLPIAGSPVIRHRPGAGVWVGEAGEGNNLYVTAKRNKAMLGLRREF
jgi:hypothetical protein